MYVFHRSRWRLGAPTVTNVRVVHRVTLKSTAAWSAAMAKCLFLSPLVVLGPNKALQTFRSIYTFLPRDPLSFQEHSIVTSTATSVFLRQQLRRPVLSATSRFFTVYCGKNHSWYKLPLWIKSSNFLGKFFYSSFSVFRHSFRFNYSKILYRLLQISPFSFAVSFLPCYYYNLNLLLNISAHGIIFHSLTSFLSLFLPF